MTLLELLVKEFPKHGGWPEDVWHVTQDSDGQVNGYGDGEPYINTNYWNSEGFIRYLFGGKIKPLSANWETSVITREQYEAAIAAQQPVWDGEGLPPVGCECEFQANDGSWGVGTVLCVGKHRVFWLCHEDGIEYNAEVNPPDFRPIRTEADRKREEAIQAMYEVVSQSGYDTPEPVAIYDAIAAGKIPGVELSK